MTLGHVYDMDLRRNENTIKEVIIQAQGEVCILAVLIWPNGLLTARTRWPLKSTSDKSRRHGQTILWTLSTIRTSVG